MDPSDAAVIELYIGTFAARMDGWVKDSARHVHGELTVDTVEDAFTKGFSVSGYMARWIEYKDKRHCLTHVGAIDFDMDDGKQVAVAAQENLTDYGIPSMLVDSRRGAHLWVTATLENDRAQGEQLNAFIRQDAEVQRWRDALGGAGMLPATIIRDALTALCQKMDLDPTKAEVFPKVSTSKWGVGALRMPLMTHPKTQERYPAYGAAGEALTGMKAVIGRMADVMAATPGSALLTLGKSKRRPTKVAPPDYAHREPRVASGDAPMVTELLSRHFGIQAVPGRTTKCPFHDDEKASMSIAQDDERVWCKAPSCPIYGDERGSGFGSFGLEKMLLDKSVG